MKTSPILNPRPAQSPKPQAAAIHYGAKPKGTDHQLGDVWYSNDARTGMLIWNGKDWVEVQF